MDTPLHLYNSYLEVNLDTICENYRRAKSHIGTQTDIIPVLKADAYGLGAAAVAEALVTRCGAGIIAVSHIMEAIQLREHGINCDILLLGTIRPDITEAAVTHRIQVPVFTEELIYALAAEARNQRQMAVVQLPVNTGLNRLGAKPGPELQAVLDALRTCRDRIEVAGVYTHFATGQEHDSVFARSQYDLFLTALRQAADSGFEPGYIHACDSGASDWFREAYGTHVRLARRLYMRHYDTDFFMNDLELPLEPASWRAPVVHIRTVHPGESIGYDRAVIADREMKVALVGVGYGDGLYPGILGKPDMVYVNDTLTSYLAMCMDQCFIDITDIPCKTGDEVTLFGYTRTGRFLSVEEVGIKAGKDGCYLQSLLTDRVARVYI